MNQRKQNSKISDFRELIIEPSLDLKPLLVTDAEPLFSIIDSERKYLRQWLGWLDRTTSIEELYGFIRYSEQARSEGKELVLVMREKNRPVGLLTLKDVDQTNGTGSIGYWLSERSSGKGIVTRCLKALLRWSFEDLELNEVSIRCATSNFKSRAVAERVGAEFVKTVEKAENLYGVYVDHAVYRVRRTGMIES